jgi:large subunit ribosomal protein L17
MRHRVPGNRLSRPQDQRKALLRSLTTELLRHDEITTTLAKAKALRSEAERIITLAKRGRLEDPMGTSKKAKEGDAEAAKQLASALHCRRQVAAYLYDGDVVKKVFDETAVRCAKRQGGYTRIIKTGYRRGDATPMAIIQLVD